MTEEMEGTAKKERERKREFLRYRGNENVCIWLMESTLFDMQSIIFELHSSRTDVEREAPVNDRERVTTSQRLI